MASACVGTPNPGNVDADDAHAVDLLRQQAQRHPRSRGNAEIDDDDRVVLVRVGQLEDSVANVFEQLPGHQRFGVERHISHACVFAP